MTTWIDTPNDYAESAARDAEDALCAPEMARCPVCGGSGEVRWNPSRENDPQCVESAECRYCDGQGAIEVQW